MMSEIKIEVTVKVKPWANFLVKTLEQYCKFVLWVIEKYGIKAEVK